MNEEKRREKRKRVKRVRVRARRSMHARVSAHVLICAFDGTRRCRAGVSERGAMLPILGVLVDLQSIG